MDYVERIMNSGGKFFTVTFIKKDGSKRVMNARLGVEKYLKGGTCKLSREDYIIVFDMQSKGYRAVNKQSIIDLKGV